MNLNWNYVFRKLFRTIFLRSCKTNYQTFLKIFSFLWSTTCNTSQLKQTSSNTFFHRGDKVCNYSSCLRIRFRICFRLHNNRQKEATSTQLTVQHKWHHMQHEQHQQHHQPNSNRITFLMVKSIFSSRLRENKIWKPTKIFASQFLFGLHTHIYSHIHLLTLHSNPFIPRT